MTKILIYFIIISLSNAYDINQFTIKSINDTLKTILNQKSYQTDMSTGDAKKGKEIFENRIKFYCGLSDVNILPIHTQNEWEEIAQAGKFKEEILKICPKLKDIYKDKWSADLYQFFYEYASDSGNIPSF